MTAEALQRTQHDLRSPAWRPVWKGVVMLIRTDLAQCTQGIDTLCQVVSARLITHGGRRAISTKVPYSLVRHYFQVEDGDAVEVYAELMGEHLEFFERASKREFFLHTPETSSSPAH